MGLRDRLGLTTPQPDEPVAEATVDGFGYCWHCRAFHADDAPWCLGITDRLAEPEWVRRRRENGMPAKDYTRVN
jgi:hypothetical protein